jgi:hypothetical protein
MPPAGGASRDCGRPRHPPCGRRTGRGAAALDRRPAGRRARRVHGQDASARAAGRVRNQHSATAALAWVAAASRSARPSHGEPLATLRPPAFESHAPGARSHACAEAMRPCALAFLRLVSAFHDSRPARAVPTRSGPVYAAPNGPPGPPRDSSRRPPVFLALCANARLLSRWALVYSPAPEHSARAPFYRCPRPPAKESTTPV